MDKRKMTCSKKAIISALLSVILMFSMFLPSYAQERTGNNDQPKRLGSVLLRDNVRAEVSNLILLPADNGQSVSFTLTVDNNSNTELDFIDYWVDLYSKSGTKFSIGSASANITKIPAKSSKDLVFYSNIGSNFRASDLVIKIIKWDFSYSEFKKVVGEITVPQNYSDVIPAGEKGIISVGDSKLSIVITKANIGKSEKFHRPELKITLKNEGKRSLTIPDYEFSIMTEDGLLYPLNAKNLKGTALSPLAEKEFQLTASIPIEADTNNWKLAITNSVNEGKAKIPVAKFDLPERKIGDGGDIGKFYTFSNSDGVYDVKLDSIHRLPFEDEDLIVSNLTIANNGTDTLPLPDFAAQYTLNEKIEQNATVSINNKIISISPGASVNFQVVTSVPYTFDISKVQLTIQQKDTGDGQAEEFIDLVEFNHTGSFDKIPKVDRVYVNHETGYRSNVSIRNLFTYEGTSGNIIAAEIEIENLEKRQSEVQKMTGYFENGEGTIYPATLQAFGEKIVPGGRAIINAYATVPKTFSTEGLKLVLGKAIENGTGEAKQTIAYVNPQSFDLPAEKEAQKTLQNIDVAPFNLSIQRVSTQARFDSGHLLLEFDYTLEQDLLVKNSAKERTIVIELEDGQGRGKFSKQLKLSDDKVADALEIGEHTVNLEWQDSDLVMQLNLLRNYNFNVYIEIESGYKKLVATQQLPWLVNRSLTDN